jgi:GNAT superfamily N-acetyltransferase
VVRIAGADDSGAISDIGLNSFREAYEHTCAPDDLILHLDEFHTETAVVAQMGCPGNDYLIAENGGQPAGFAKVRESLALPEVPATRLIELHQLYVQPDQQRFGLGGYLLEAVLNYVRGKGAEGVWLSAWEEATWAVNFYHKHGFATVGATDFRLGNTVYIDLLMWKPVMLDN